MTLTSEQKTQLFYNRGQSLTALSHDLSHQLKTLTDAQIYGWQTTDDILEQVIETTSKIASWHNDFTKQRDFGND